MANKDTHHTLFVVSRFEFRDSPGKGFELRVVHVVSGDGKSRGAGVEKVYFYDEGRKAIPKVLQAKDFAKLKEKWADVKHYLENPGEVPAPPEPIPLDAGAPMDAGGGFGTTGGLDGRSPDLDPVDF